MSFAAIVLLPFSLGGLCSAEWWRLSKLEILGVGYVVFFATFVAYICIMIGQKNLRPTLVGMYNYVQPIVASVVGVWLGLDSFTFIKIIAVMLIFTGVFLVTISKAKEQPTR